jgi:hypothetical protein
MEYKIPVSKFIGMQDASATWRQLLATERGGFHSITLAQCSFCMVLVASVGLELRRRGDVEVNIHSSVLKNRRVGGLKIILDTIVVTGLPTVRFFSGLSWF